MIYIPLTLQPGPYIFTSVRSVESIRCNSENACIENERMISCNYYEWFEYHWQAVCYIVIYLLKFLNILYFYVIFFCFSNKQIFLKKEKITMHKRLLKIAGITVFLIIMVYANSYVQDQTHVRITFDSNSERIDIVTGKQLPDYTQAQRGSFRFYEGRLDSPTDHIHYMFSTMISSNIKDIVLMRKFHAQNVWGLSGSGNILGLKDIIVADIVKEYSVSFIPLNPVTSKPEPRVYVLLEDLYLIQWADVDHWATTKSQAEYESEKGIVY